MNNTGGEAFAPRFSIPAFPRNILDHGHGVTTTHDSGMTLRDYFAAKAMTTMFYPAIMESIRTDEDLDCLKVAGFAYAMADAMLAAREQK